MSDLVTLESVKSRLMTVRGQTALLDRDVAELYGVETRIVNQAVRNNPDKFPAGYVFELDASELEVLRSKTLTLERHRQPQSEDGSLRNGDRVELRRCQDPASVRS